jgi:predicted DNA-binding protein
MSVMSVRIDDQKKQALKIIASIEGKSMGGIVAELIETYIDEKKEVLIHLSERENLKELMKMSEFSFSEWDNQEDDIYNNL